MNRLPSAAALHARRVAAETRASVRIATTAAHRRRVAADLGAAVPDGYRPAIHPLVWVATVKDTADFDYRPDAVTRRTDIAWVLVDHTDWATATTCCSWPRLTAHAHLSRGTVARAMAWLRAHHLIAVVTSGTRSGRAHQSNVYVLLERQPRF